MASSRSSETPEVQGLENDGGSAEQAAASGTKGQVQLSDVVRRAVNQWRERIQGWYPDLLCGRTFVPSVYMNRTWHEEVEVCGQPVLVMQPPVAQGRGLQRAQVRDDVAQQKVLDCIRCVSDSQSDVMVVVSQLLFKNYLNQFLNNTDYAQAAARLPKPRDKELKKKGHHQGDFDVLIIHRHHGVLVGEIKSVGDQFDDMSSEERVRDLIFRVKDADKQLEKSRYVLNHLLSHHAMRPMVKTALMVPNISTAQLRSMLAANEEVRKSVCRAVGVALNADPIPLCLTSDVLSQPDQWWRSLKGTMDPAMTEDLYMDIVACFAGPATTVTVHCSTIPRLAAVHCAQLRTLGEGVAETGSRFTPVDIILHPDQAAILNSQTLRLVGLWGPFGCGKTVCLVLKALQWLRRGKPVHVVSTYNYSLAATHMIVGQLEQTAGPAARQLITMHAFKLEEDLDFARAVMTLTNAIVDGQLFVIADEVGDIGEHFNTLCTELDRRVPDLHLWVTSLHSKHIPSMITAFAFTVPLRNPPAVTRLLQQDSILNLLTQPYTAVPSPLASDGPAPRDVIHAGQGHCGDITECVQCGHDTGIFVQQLVVNSAGSLQPVHYRDVFVLTDLYFFDSETDASGQVTRPASGFLTGLRGAGVPVTVLKRWDAERVRDVATMAEACSDKAVAADCYGIFGLERRVVVCVDGRSIMHMNMYSISRCTAQLIWVRNPPNRNTNAAAADDDDVDYKEEEEQKDVYNR